MEPHRFYKANNKYSVKYLGSHLQNVPWTELILKEDTK